MASLHPQVPTAQGRYLVSNSMTVSTKVARDALAKAFPGYQFPAGQDTPSKLVIDNSKVRAGHGSTVVRFSDLPDICGLISSKQYLELYGPLAKCQAGQVGSGLGTLHPNPFE